MPKEYPAARRLHRAPPRTSGPSSRRGRPPRELDRAGRRPTGLVRLDLGLGQELATPSDFEEAAAMVDEQDVAESTPCGPDPEPYLEQIRKYDDAGFTHVYMHQIGDNQDEFVEFAARELMSA
jgi:hypothetical protein